MNISSSDIINVTDGVQGITSHACTSSEGWIAWILTLSLWFVLFSLIMMTDEKHWAVGAASFPAMIFAIGFMIFGCGAETLLIIMIILSVLGLAGGFIASRR